jgi:hypothetical protein
MHRLHLARAPILVHVTGLGKDVVPLLRFWARVGCLGIRPQSVKHFRENGSLRYFRELANGRFCFQGQEYHPANFQAPWGVTLPNICKFGPVGLAGMIKEIE